MELLFEDLKFRGLIYQVSDEKKLRKKLEKEKIVLYCGFDPTASSLHIGHLLLILTLKRFQKYGHKPIALIGGATGLIGDPSGKIKERSSLSEEKVKEWGEKLKSQLEKFLDFKTKKNPAKIVDNFEWLSKINLIDFLRDYGKLFQVSQMISKETIKKRISTTGISFCEFSYMILQAIDFLKLYEIENCQLQIGGSDQWGNIICGIDLIKKIHPEAEVFGLTLPLILTKSGRKFGKTEKGAIFLDKNLTSPYEFYQFWINTDDRDVCQFLKYFTFLEKSEIENLEEEVKKNPKEKKAQKILADEVTKLVHGEAELNRVKRISQILFYGTVYNLKEEEIKEALFNVPTTQIYPKEISILDLLVESKVAKSKSEAKRLISQGGISINGTTEKYIERKFSPREALFGKYFIIKKGKKNYYLVELLK